MSKLEFAALDPINLTWDVSFRLFDPMERVERPKRERFLPKALTEDQLKALLAELNPKTVFGIRDRAIILLLAGTGLFPRPFPFASVTWTFPRTRSRSWGSDERSAGSPSGRSRGGPLSPGSSGGASASMMIRFSATSNG